jgi:hypothetical protein
LVNQGGAFAVHHFGKTGKRLIFGVTKIIIAIAERIPVVG